MQLAAALKRHPDLRVIEIDPVPHGGDPDWQAKRGGWRLRPDFWPEHGGLDGFIDEMWLRGAVRGRGMGGEALAELIKSLGAADVKALHLEVSEGSAAERLYHRLGFRRRSYALLTRLA